MLVVGIVLGEHVLAEITFEAAPNGMNVIRVVLSVIRLYQVTSGLNSVVVGFSGLGCTNPSENEMIPSFFLDLVGS